MGAVKEVEAALEQLALQRLDLCHLRAYRRVVSGESTEVLLDLRGAAAIEQILQLDHHQLHQGGASIRTLRILQILFDLRIEPRSESGLESVAQIVIRKGFVAWRLPFERFVNHVDLERRQPRDRAAGLNPEMLAGGGASAGVGAPPSPVAANRLEISPSLTRAQPLPPPSPPPLARPLSPTHTHPVPARSCAPAPAVELRKQIRCDLFLRNAGSTAVAFKVKTTAPKKYCVRPNIGIVAPGATVEVQVIMQSQKEQPADLAACRDKFLVQSVETTAAEASQLDASTFQKAEGKTIGESKLRVAYTTPAMPPTVSEEGLASPMATPAGRAAANNGGGGATYDNDLDAATMNYKASQVRVRARRRRRRSRVRAREGGVGGRAGRRADAPPCHANTTHSPSPSLPPFSASPSLPPSPRRLR